MSLLTNALSPQTIPFPSSRAVLSAAASLAASVVLFRSILYDLIPDGIRDYFSSRLRILSNRLSSELTLIIEESDGLATNQMFEAANLYLSTKITSSVRRIKVSHPPKEKKPTLSADRNQEILDVFRGVHFKWVSFCVPVEQPPRSRFKYYGAPESTRRSDIRSVELSFPKKHIDTVLGSYLPYILHQSKLIKEERKVIKLHSIDYNRSEYWGPINLDHPATFDTLAMEPELKKAVMDDLQRFVKRKEFYRRVGRAWKRGYLLYGPPGTGKSSLVAAMANYLNFDIYDLDLTEVLCNLDLRKLLVGTANRSILVMEDVDCNIEFRDREVAGINNKVTLSGLLNCIDGLWSSCGDERIIVFTTNKKERLDPALLRPGRMDLHIHMSYCTPSGFRQLAFNYLGVRHHQLFREIERLIEEVDATPADVAGELMKTDDVEVGLKSLVEFLQSKKNEFEKTKTIGEDGQTGTQQSQK